MIIDDNPVLVTPSREPWDGAELVDSLGRVARTLRVSLTDRCTLRCRYCLPADGVPWMPTEEMLTDDEVVRLVRLAVERLGVRRVRLTGGEPLLRRGLVGIVARIAELRTALGTPPRIALTTNGVSLARWADDLAAAGVGRVNVSLDTLDPELYAAMTRRDRLADVLAGLAAARRAGLTPIKVNAVLLRGVNDHEAVPLVRWAVREGYRLRFIEQMPLGPAQEWDRSRLVTAAEILERLRAELDLVPLPAAQRGSAPAEMWQVAGTDAEVGVIGAVTRPFCAACDRVRLTADGHVRTCLFAATETDLRSLLRAGAGDEELARAWRTAMLTKPAAGIRTGLVAAPDRLMSEIGG
ncbi:GTP 3',8-cyclase MoaA [Isoptericola sp. b490]|uniref:GTP 3',8-cyclase MoaA n=1 Tax=Actinotalea lenta TaxID=3064654 RepID=UPI00271244BA|nr:GTP 3',8-cyclase MoaA [Isoptericola sp. b490]MDO8119794.1 GTP 3',8-cyclase MoaA [Isoptericola sp. b490]